MLRATQTSKLSWGYRWAGALGRATSHLISKASRQWEKNAARRPCWQPTDTARPDERKEETGANIRRNRNTGDG
eukprot:6838039-Lingulodinium_polyedra.AAC.1